MLEAPVVARSCRRSPNTDSGPAISLKAKAAAAATATYASAPASTSKGTSVQAESAIPSDPFAMPSSTATVTPPRPKQQRRRTPQPIPIAAPSPVQQHARSVPLPHRRPAKTLLPAFEFPICDDLSDTDDAAPPTPTRRSRPRRRPAPTLPPVTTSAPHPQGKRARNHKRAPSDSGMIFAMSSDESGSEHPPSRAHSNGYKAQVQQSAELNALFANLALARTGMRTPPPQAREAMYEAMARREVSGYTGGRGTGQGYFASSSFQNSPSPEELPDPLFV
ncbi:hypothetical protein DXG01_005860 [Tephrocybe rancida]|nr:hypothetical protein DXG01_005860 [Tephrocybe rancida]